MAESRLLVLDVGSSSVRAWLYDERARGEDPGPGAQRAYAWRTHPAGAMECDADGLVAFTAGAIDGAMERARALGTRIAAVAAAAFWHSLLGVDAAGKAITPVFGWGDTRARDVALRLGGEADAAAYHARTGCFFHPSYPMVKLAWLRRREPELTARVAAWLSFPEYLELRLTGRRRCSYSMGSGSGLMDVHRLEWDPEALERAGVSATQLAPLCDAVPERGLRPEYAARWPELRDAGWFPALGDGACANVGSGAVGVERLGLTIGTSAALRLLWEPPGDARVPEDLWCYRLDGRRWVAGGALSNGGNAVAFLRRVFRLPAPEGWRDAVAAMEPDSHGLTVLPFLLGERGPGWLRERRSALVGATLATTPEQVLRAWMEAVAYRLDAVHERLSDEVGTSVEVRASGGALEGSPAWNQILSDVLGRPVALTAEHEATARGAAAVALEQLGRIGDLSELEVPMAVRYEPDPERHARYTAAAARQEALLELVAPWAGTAPLPAPGAAAGAAERPPAETTTNPETTHGAEQ